MAAYIPNARGWGEQELSGWLVGTAWNKYTISYLRGDKVKIDEFGEVLESLTPDDTVVLLFAGIGAWHTERRTDLDGLIDAAQEAGQIDPLIRQRASNLAQLALAARTMNRPSDAIRAGEIAQPLLLLPKLTSANEASARIAVGLAAVAAGDVHGARENYGRLQNSSRTLVGGDHLLSGDRLLGLLAHTAGMPEESSAHFEDALKFTRKAGYRLELAWTCHDYAETLLDSDQSSNAEKAISLVDDGLGITRDLGLVAIEKRLIALQEKATSISAPAPAYPDGLTAREVEVRRLLAAGRTNQQIADDLFTAPGTAAKHVANILGKTGTANRAEAATYANQRGLVEA